MDGLEALRRRLARDDAVTEVIAYVMMFAIGAMAMVFAMEVLTDAQRRGNDVAAARQADRLGQVTASLVEQAARVAETSPNATYNSTFALPNVIGNHNLTLELTKEPISGGTGCQSRTTLHVFSRDEQIETSFQLGNVSSIEVQGACLEFSGSLDASAQAGQVRYERSAATGSTPTIFLEPASKVR